MAGKTEKRYRNKRAKRTRGMAMRLLGMPPGKAMERPDQRRLVGEVLMQSSDPRMKEIALRALDPRPEHASVSVAGLAVAAKVGMVQAANEFKALVKAQGLIDQMADLPLLMKQTSENAKDRWITCTECGGSGRWGLRGKHCLTCKGKGQVWQPGSMEALRMVFETAGLVGSNAKQGNVTQAVQIHIGNETMADLAATVAPIIEGVES